MIASDSAVPTAGLFLFTRFPQPGQTKTRLIPTLGAVGAADLQRQMTEHLLGRFRGFCLRRQLVLEVHFAGGDLVQMRHWLGDTAVLTPQCEGDLGDRLSFALQQGFAVGLQQIIVIGSDCPDITEGQILRALSLLKSHDVVLGPALDGGYYLIGLNRLHSSLFEHIPWSTAQVLETTQAIAHRHDLSIALLNPLSDIDRPEDLPLWNAHLATATAEGSSNMPQRGL
ncbi:MAG: TIGR04282 family arsenosugar biosynthesis glycosyltransferase [Phormidesmis sp.]